MIRINTEQVDCVIASASIEFLDTHEVEALTSRPGSYCHFFDPIIVENYKIILRLDWSDIDENGDPTLDADFYNEESGKKLRLYGARRTAHHTSATSSTERIYEWEFRDFSRPFRVKVNWATTIKEELTMGDHMSFEVVRNGVKVGN